MKSPSSHVLIRNSAWLTLLVASNYVFGFLIIPVWTRVLTPPTFALVGFGQVVALYAQLVVDFGFTVSGTERVARAVDHPDSRTRAFSSVMWGKICLTAVSVALFGLASITVPAFKDHLVAFWLFLLSGALAGLTPDFAYRGIERMAPIAIRVTVLKALAFVVTILFVHSDANWLLIPSINALGNAISALWMIVGLARFGFNWRRAPLREIAKDLRHSMLFFWSRISANIYTATNTFVLGLTLGTSSLMVANYVAADKLGAAASSITTPISDSLYPRMMHAPNLMLLRKVLLVTTPVLALGCGLIGVFASPLCAIVFGPQYADAARPLRILLVIVVVKYIGMILGFPALSPIGLSRTVNSSVIIGAAVQLAAIAVLVGSHTMSVEAICLASLTSQVVVLAIKAVALARHRSRYAELAYPDAQNLPKEVAS